METGGRILLDLLVVFIAAKLGGEIAERLKQPAIIGEIALGLLVGALGIAGHSDAVKVAATIGAIILLFQVGLETDVKAVLAIGARAAVVAVLGIVVPFVLGFILMAVWGAPTVESMFLGTALVATSVGITARVLSDLGVLGSIESRIILAAAVLDDILGLLVLSGVTAIAKAGSVPLTDIVLLLGKGVFFIIATGLLIPLALNRHGFLIERLRHRNALFSIALASCIGFALLAEFFGLAAIVGAFLAGLGFAGVPNHKELKKNLSPVSDFVVPLFFVSVGMQVDLGSLLSPEVLTLGVIVSILAVAGKLVGCGLGAVGMKAKSVLIVGVGMVPRGEVGLIVASIGKGLGVIPDSLVAIITLVSITTTVIVPPLLPLLFRMPEPLPEPEPAT
ncbi:MAG: cation:proton antiporter [Candidatus Aquicultorales bacterium]